MEAEAQSWQSPRRWTEGCLPRLLKHQGPHSGVLSPSPPGARRVSSKCMCTWTLRMCTLRCNHCVFKSTVHYVAGILIREEARDPQGKRPGDSKGGTGHGRPRSAVCAGAGTAWPSASPGAHTAAPASRRTSNKCHAPRPGALLAQPTKSTQSCMCASISVSVQGSGP